MAHPLAALIRRRDRVTAAIQSNVGPSGLDAARAAEAALAVLPPGVDYAAVYRSLISLHGQLPPPGVVKDAAWALAGDVATLRAKTPVYPPRLPAAPARVVVQFVAAAQAPQRGDDDGTRTRFRVRVASGPGTPSLFEVTWSDKFVRYRATHPTGLGFFRSKRAKVPVRPFTHPLALVGMLARATLEADSLTGRPKLADVGGTETVRAFNRALTELRFRTEFVCPFNFTHPCHTCPKGLESCQAACRPLDLRPGACPRCARPDALTDPAWPGDNCAACKARR